MTWRRTWPLTASSLTVTGWPAPNLIALESRWPTICSSRAAIPFAEDGSRGLEPELRARSRRGLGVVLELLRHELPEVERLVPQLELTEGEPREVQQLVAEILEAPQLS